MPYNTPYDIYNTSSQPIGAEIYDTANRLGLYTKLAPELMSERAAKANYALGRDSPGFAQLFDTFSQGRESEVRQTVADKENLRAYDVKLNLLRETAAKLPKDVNPMVLQYLMGIAAKPEISPDLSLEHSFARQYINDVVFNGSKKDVFGKSFDKAADETLRLHQTAQDLVTRYQAFLTLNEELNSRYKDLPVVDYPWKNSKLYSYARNLSDIVNWYDISNVIKGAPAAFSPGGKVEEQARYAWTSPVKNIPDVVKGVRELFNSNPHAALELSNAMLRYTSDETLIKNALVGLNIGTSASLTGVTAGIGKLAGGTLSRLEGQFAVEAAGGARKAVRGAKTAAETAETQTKQTGLQPKLLTDQRPKDQKLLEDLRPGSDKYTRQEEMFSTGSDIYTRQGDLFDREWSPVRDQKGSLRFERYGEGKDVYELGYPTSLRKALPRDDQGRFIKVPKEQLELPVTTPQKETQIEAPLVGGRGTKPTAPVSIDKVPETPKPITKEDYLAASVAFRRGPREFAEAGIAYVDAITATAVRKIDPQITFSRLGDIENAATIGAAKEIKAKLDQIDPEEILQPLIPNAPHWYNPNIYAKPVDSVSGVAASRLAEKAIQRVLRGMDLLSKTTRVSRHTEESLQQAIDTTRAFDMQGFKQMGHGLVNAYSTFSVIPPDKTLTNAGLVKYWFGKPDATSFDKMEEAYTMATQGYKLPEDGFKIRQEGSGYYIVITKPIRETTDEVLDHLLETQATKVPNSWSNFLLRWAKTSDSLTSLHDTRARKVATTAPSALRAFAQDALDEIQKLGKEERNELRKVMEADRVYEDPVTGKIGTYQRTLADFEKLFIQLTNKLPTEGQKSAYNLTIQLNDFDYILRGLDWLRDLHRQGAELVRFHFPTDLLNATSDTNLKPTNWFMGRRVNDINWDARGDAVIWYWDGSTGATHVFHKLDKDPDTVALKGSLRTKIRDGEMQVIEVGNPKSNPLKNELGINAPINYVITNTAQYKPLKITDIAEYRPGGHIIYANQYWLKQPVIRPGYKGRLYHYGDLTIMGADSLREIQLLEKHWNEAQNILKTGDDVALANYLANNLPIDIKRFKQYYSGGGPGGGLSTEHPVKWVETNKDVFETHPSLKDAYPELKEQLAAPDMMQYLDKRFIADRGQIVDSFRARGTESNPLYSIETPSLVSPYVAMTRAMGNSIKGRWMGDYKHLAAEHWIEQFGNLLNIRKEELRNNPLYYLTRANENYNYSADRMLLRAAEEARQRVINFVGYRSDISRDYSYVERKILEAVENHKGKEWSEYLQDGIMEKIRDPATHLRAFAFHPNMGMFNPFTYLTQVNTLTNILAISPKYAVQSMAAAFLQRGMLRTEDPAIWAKYAKVASKLGWRADEFLESFEAMKRTNWHMVGGEVAWKDSVAELTPFKSLAGKFLDKGTIFFNEGERSVRMSAWNAAFKEWKNANPNKVMSAFDESNILARADDMGVNMTRASNARWNQGIWSIPTQYFSYQARLMEQIWEGIAQTGAKKLSRAEAGRLMAANSIIYGIPVGAGSVMGFYNPYEDIKQRAIERGWPIHDNWFKLANDGLTSFIMSQVTGRDYNIAQRYGPGGNDSLLQVLRGNKKLYEALGAAPNTLFSVIGTMYPMLKALYSNTIGDGSFRLTMQDFIAASEPIKSANTLVKAWYMYNTHNYTTKNQTVVNSVTDFDALAMGLFGLTPRSVTDTFAALKNEKSIKEAKDWYIPKINEAIKSALKYYADGDDKAGDTKMDQANAWIEGAGLTWKERVKVFKQGLEHENLYDMAERRRQMRKATTPTK